jgi:serine/threonine-protein kinase
MGVVYKAIDPLIGGRPVAVKVILIDPNANIRDIEIMREGLLREVRSAGLLSHPNIVTLYDVGVQDNAPFIAMECVDGTNLQGLIKTSGRIEVPKALDILQQAAGALDYAHRNGVIHRDIKPANILLHRGVAVKLADFGIAKLQVAGHRTATGLVMGTPGYMSPEQIQALPLDGRSDQFALACVAFLLLTGEKPFPAESVPVLMHAMLFGKPPSATSINPLLPQAVNRVLLCGLARSPESRFATCTEFVSQLAAALGFKTGVGIPALVVEAEQRPAPVYTPPVAAPPPPISPALPASWKAPPTPVHASPPSPRTQKPAPVIPPAPIPLRYVVVGLCVATAAAIFLVISALPPIPITSVATPAPDTGKPRVAAARPQPLADLGPATTGLKKPGSPNAGQQPSAPPPPASGIVTGSTAPGPPPRVDASQYYAEGAAAWRKGDRARGLDLFRKAAELGDVTSMKKLGAIYGDGDGVAADAAEAAKWVHKAADAGDLSSIDLFGQMLANGTGVPKNESLAVAWYKRAADGGYAAAQYDLGTMYEDGRGVAVDLKVAMGWYRLAAIAGDHRAKQRFSRLSTDSPRTKAK